MFVEQRDAGWWFKLNAAARLAVVKGALNGFAKPIVVTEYPKSGGTWLSQMLSAALDIPYPRNRLPFLQSQLIHGCYLNVNENIDTVLVWRDGRDTMVSFYYHLVFEKPITSANYSRKVRKILDVKDPYDIQEKLPAFIEWTFNGGYPGYSWADFVRNWYGRSSVIETSYEAVTENPLRELMRILNHFGNWEKDPHELQAIVDSCSFEAQSSRKPGEEDVTSFIRKGIVGDWKNVFTKEAREVFNHYAGKELVLLGYEEDSSWV